MIGDTEPYRTQEEVAEWQARDPILTFPNRLVEEFDISTSEVDAVPPEVESIMAEVVRFALDSSWPSPDEVTDDIFA